MKTRKLLRKLYRNYIWHRSRFSGLVYRTLIMVIPPFYSDEHYNSFIDWKRDMEVTTKVNNVR